MRYIVKGNFKPLNNRQLKFIHDIQKKYSVNDIYLLNKGDNEEFFEVSISEYDYLHSINKKMLKKEDKIIKIDRELEINYREGDFREFSEKTVDYIFGNKKILTEVAEYKLSEKRFKHSVSVAVTAADIARYNRLDEFNTYTAGLLHDICKEMDVEEERKLMTEYFPEQLGINRKVYHQFTAYVFLKEYMKCKKPDVMNAVLHHVDGSSDKTMAMAIYIADKIEPLRGYDTTEEKILYKVNLKTCFDRVKATQVKYLEKQNGKKRNNN